MSLSVSLLLCSWLQGGRSRCSWSAPWPSRPDPRAQTPQTAERPQRAHVSSRLSLSLFGLFSVCARACCLSLSCLCDCVSVSLGVRRAEAAGSFSRAELCSVSHFFVAACESCDVLCCFVLFCVVLCHLFRVARLPRGRCCALACRQAGRQQTEKDQQNSTG